MPTILREGPYRLFFYSGDRHEPRHVHIERDGAEAKLWLHDVRPAFHYGFAARELGAVIALVRSRRAELIEAWDEYFGGN